MFRLSGNPAELQADLASALAAMSVQAKTPVPSRMPHPIKGGAAPTALYYRRYRPTCHRSVPTQQQNCANR